FVEIIPAKQIDDASKETSHGSSLSGLKDLADGIGHAPVLREFAIELLPPRTSEFVIAGAAIFFGFAPVAIDPAVDQQALERGVKRAFFYSEHFFGTFLDRLGDFEPVQLTLAGEGLQDQHLQSAGR